MIFKVLLIQHLHNLSDDTMEYQLFHRLSFRRFTGCDECKVHDAKTIWLYRERLTKSGKEQELFEQFYLTLAEKGLLAHQGQIVDAPFVESPKQRNTREENQQIKQGNIPTQIGIQRSVLKKIGIQDGLGRTNLLWLYKSYYTLRKSN